MDFYISIVVTVIKPIILKTNYHYYPNQKVGQYLGYDIMIYYELKVSSTLDN